MGVSSGVLLDVQITDTPKMLTDQKIKNLKEKDKQYKVTDEKGMFLLIKTNGGKYWRFKYRFAGKEKSLSIGVYPEISLKQARLKRDEAKKLLSNNIDPSEIKQSAKLSESEDSFEYVAREWHIKHKTHWTISYAERVLTRLEKDVFPWIGKNPINEINAPELLTVFRRVENRGALDTSHRVMQNCGQVFRYAVATGRADRDPTNDLKGALPPVRKKHLASITEPKKIGGLLRALDGYDGTFVVKCALKVAPLVFVRPVELRTAEWEHIDFDTKEWRIPPEKMKMRVLHIVPLSKQALDILNEIKPLTGSGRYVFPSIRTDTRPMSENTVLGAIRRLGYEKGEMTGHGFRSMASTILNEQGWNRDAIERQLAHAERDSVRASYNYAEFLPERREMMQKWADYLDALKDEPTMANIRAVKKPPSNSIYSTGYSTILYFKSNIPIIQGGVEANVTPSRDAILGI